LKKTPLNQVHRDLGARMVPFGGWDMPVQYSGVIDEHLATRNRVGLFDVSHMGEVEVVGSGALDYIQQLTVNDASKLVDGQVQYSAICYPNGGTVDDVTLYRFSAERYLFCVNAANTDKDFAWMQQQLQESGVPNVELRNLSNEFCQIALQGPRADEVLQGLTSVDLSSVAFYHFTEGGVAGLPAIISRTGYTGSGGFEIYAAADAAVPLWTALMKEGEEAGIAPCGLGARDTLRLEMKYALYGHELSEDISPLEAGLGWITKLDKGDFVGREALQGKKDAGLPRRLAGLKMTESGIPREGYPVYRNGEEVGIVTSGTMSPCLKVGIALALLPPEFCAIGTDLQVGIRKRQVACQTVKTPFVNI